MFSQSQKFNDAVKYSHIASILVEVYEGVGGDLLYSTDDLNITSGLLDGEVTVSDATIRRRVNLKLVDPTTGSPVPTQTVITSSSGDEVQYDAAIAYDDPIMYDGRVTQSIIFGGEPPELPLEEIFHPYGNEVRLYRGIQFEDGSIERIPLGVFQIASTSIDDSGSSLTVTVDAFDRARTVSRATLTQDYYIPAGTLYTQAIEDLIRGRVPGLSFNFISLHYTTPELVAPTGADPWKVAQQMATAIGCELFFDVLGVCTLRTISDYSLAPVVWQYKEGEEAMLLYTNKYLTSDTTYNYYIVTGENSGNAVPVRGDAFDDNPRSRTYYKGSYGIVPAPVVSTKLVTSNLQAAEAANALLQKGVGKAERIHFNSIVNPGHDIGDVIEVVRSRSRVNNRYVVGQISIPLVHSRAMDIVSRVRQGIR